MVHKRMFAHEHDHCTAVQATVNERVRDTSVGRELRPQVMLSPSFVSLGFSVTSGVFSLETPCPPRGTSKQTIDEARL